MLVPFFISIKIVCIFKYLTGTSASITRHILTYKVLNKNVLLQVGKTKKIKKNKKNKKNTCIFCTTVKHELSKTNQN